MKNFTRTLVLVGTVFAWLYAGCVQARVAYNYQSPENYQQSMRGVAHFATLVGELPRPASTSSVTTPSGLPVLYTSGAVALSKPHLLADVMSLLSIYWHDAEKGDAAAQFSMGIIYNTGLVGLVARDPSEAVKWYRLSAQQGFVDAQNNLGYMFDNGSGVPQDRVQAVHWYRMAAIAGDSVAQHNLGVKYRDGEGVQRDDAQAIAWFKKSADQHDAAGQSELADLLMNGRGAAKDDATVVQLLQASAAKGNARAQSGLAEMLASGRGIARDDIKAMALYHLAAEKDDPRALNNIGEMIQRDRTDPSGIAEAVWWFGRASALGYARAKTNLAYMYAAGKGVPKSEEDVVFLRQQAADILTKEGR